MTIGGRVPWLRWVLLGVLSLVGPIRSSEAVLTTTGACPAQPGQLGVAVSAGDLCFRTDTRGFFLWDGQAWRPILTLSPAGSIATLTTDTLTVGSLSATLATSTKAGLPAASTDGKLLRVTDDVGGIFLDQGTQWIALNGGVINVQDIPGATGSGTADDRAALSSADATAGTTGTLYFPPGTYKVSSALTLTAALRFANGAKLSPDTGVAITITGAVQAGFWQIFTGAGTIIFKSGANPTDTWTFYPEWWGAKNDNSADATAAINAAIVAAFTDLTISTGGRVDFSAGIYQVAGTVLIGNGRLHLTGAGKGATWINCVQTVNDTPCVHFSKGSSVVFQSSLRRMGVLNNGTATGVIGIQASDTSELVIEDVNMLMTAGAGKGSVGIKLRGREFTTLARVSIQADKPLVIAPNPNVASIGADHLALRDAQLLGKAGLGGTCNPLITIEDGTPITNLSIDGGYQGWVGGGDGINWISTNAASDRNVVVRNIRREQECDAATYIVKIDRTNGALYNLRLENFDGPTNQKGYFLRNVRQVTLSNIQYVRADTALDIDSTVYPVIGAVVSMAAGSTASLGTLSKIYDIPSPTGPTNLGTSFALDTPTITDFIVPSLRLGTALALLTSTANDLVEQRRGANAQTFAVYNTYTAGTPDWERLEAVWSGSNAILRTAANGTGTTRSLILRYANTTANAIIIPTATTGALDLVNGITTTSAVGGRVRIAGSTTTTATSGTNTDLIISESCAPTATSTLVCQGIHIAPTINYSAGTPGAGSYEALKIAVTETALPTGANYLLRASAGSGGTTDKLTVANTGALTSLPSDNTTALTLAGGSITGSGTTVFQGLTGTWNTTGVVPGALQVNITNTASGAGSRLFELQRGGALQFGVTSGAASTGTQIRTAQATAPTCSTSCGTSPSVSGTDSHMTVTMGATGTPASGWVVTFNGTWASAPACVVASALSGMVAGKAPIVVVSTTTTLTVTTNGTAPANNDKYHILCGGVS